MAGKLQGGCQCGALRYEVSGEPVFKAFCHCENCQKSSGGGHVFHITFPDADLSVTGLFKEWSYTSEDGNQVISGFCPDCGSSVYGRTPLLSDHTSIRAGTLDSDYGFEPSMVVHERRRRKWDRDHPDIDHFEMGPSTS